MSDRPILFSAPMVRALLDGRKTQTRRVIKPCDDLKYKPGDILVSWPAGEFVRTGHRFRPRFAKGDRLWVRETWQTVSLDASTTLCAYRANCDGDRFTHADDGSVEIIQIRKWRPAIFMPRIMSRLTLTVTDVRVERLQDISEADCVAEGPPELREMRGLGRPLDGVMVVDPAQPHVGMAPRTWYRELWDTINGAGSWDENPWCVAISFSVSRRNIDAGE